MIFAAQPDATQIVGMAFFGFAAAMCALAARATRTPSPRLWYVLAAVQLACGIEVLLGARYRLHDAVNAVLRTEGWYAARGTAQIGLIGAVLALGAVGLFAALRAWRHGGAAAVAVAGSAVAITVFAIETISLHRVDSFMYAAFGPVKTIALLWAGAAFVVTGAALSHRARAARRR